LPRRTMQFTRCYKAGKGKPRLCAPGRVCPARRFHFAPPGLPFLPHRHFNPPNLSTLVAHTCRAPPAAGTAGRGGQAAAGKQAFTQHKGLPCRERAPVITLRPGRRHASARIPFGFTRITCPAALMTAFQPWQPDVSGSLRSMLRHPPPAKPEACVSPGKAYCRQSSPVALDTLSLASLTPSPVNRVLPITYYIFLVSNTPSCLARN
jgi:hypothetical protein